MGNKVQTIRANDLHGKQYFWRDVLAGEIAYTLQSFPGIIRVGEKRVEGYTFGRDGEIELYVEGLQYPISTNFGEIELVCERY